MAHITAHATAGAYRRGHAFENIMAWLTTTNHKQIGILYLVTSFAFFAIGGAMAILMRIELATPGADIIDAETYNRLFSMHGTLMIFLFIIPVQVGFGNYFVPLMIGAKDMAFPRLNALGYWLLPPAGALLLMGMADVGWTGYAPLSNQVGSQTIFGVGHSVDLWILGLIVVGTSSIIGAANFLATILKLRAPGMTFNKMPLFVWAIVATQFMALLATPVLAGALTMLFADRNLGTCFFNTAGPCAAAGTPGQPLLWQHLFWFYSHPAVYIMILPAMGIISEVLPRFAHKPIFGYKAIAYSSIAISFLGFGVWAHHMFVTGIDLRVRISMMLVTMAVAVPSGVKIFNWLATLWGGRITFQTPMLFALGFIAMFTIGGFSGVFSAVIPIDYNITDTYFVVAHLHYVLFGGSVLGVLAGAYYFFPWITGRMYNETLGKIHFALTIVGFNMVFFTMHIMGLLGMPRRIYDYSFLALRVPVIVPLNELATIGAFIIGIGQIPFVYNMIVSRWNGRLSDPHPW